MIPCMDQQLKQLYKSVILEHNARPFHFKKKEGTSHVLEITNSPCGDSFRIFFEIENGIVTEAHFHGYGCILAKASTSVLIKNLENKPLKEVLTLCKSFLKMTDPNLEEPVEVAHELFAFSAAKSFPSRLKCANLSWEHVVAFLEKQVADHEN